MMENLIHTPETMKKVYEALLEEGIYGQQAIDVVFAMQNKGILFREAKPGCAVPDELEGELEEMIAYRQRELDTALAVEKEAQKSVAYQRSELTKLYAIRTLLRARQEARQMVKEMGDG